MHASLYPWLAPPWQRLMNYRREQRMPQAILITGRQGLGKRHLAETFAALLLCQEPGQHACGHCAGCCLLAAGTHPDYVVAQPEEPGKAIPVDMVRGLIGKLNLKPQYNGHRVVVLDPAHAMNASAANALLKTLEEPPERTLLLLISAMPSAMPATLISRCQRLPVAPPARETALAWLHTQAPAPSAETALAAAAGAPLKALELMQSGLLEKREQLFKLWPAFAGKRAEPVQAAAQLTQVPLEMLIDWLYGWAIQELKLSQATATPNTGRILPPDRIHEFAEILQRSKRQLANNAQLNRQLLLEEICIAWWRLARAK
ncbi:MAG: DNA polymerase III subunit delta' [Methylococcaceae bacterium]|nr:MAG: DNA polymerase III subunit delta' [Methylococcaceae bacterium]